MHVSKAGPAHTINPNALEDMRLSRYVTHRSVALPQCSVPDSANI